MKEKEKNNKYELERLLYIFKYIFKIDLISEAEYKRILKDTNTK